MSHYLKEYRDDLKQSVDCYWEAPLPAGGKPVTFPSLPEPYVNLFVAVGGVEGEDPTDAQLKGISSRVDLLSMRSALFGVRLHLRGLIRSGWVEPGAISDRIIPWSDCPGFDKELLERIRAASGFEERVHHVRVWLAACPRPHSDSKAARLADAHEFLVSHFDDPSIIASWARRSGFASRTITRWFTKDLGIPPKRLSRIARFHSALTDLHIGRNPKFYLDAGYYDQAHFIREFREFAGMTPEQYLGMIAELADGTAGSER